jgi:hypothetical protein
MVDAGKNERLATFAVDEHIKELGMFDNRACLPLLASPLIRGKMGAHLDSSIGRAHDIHHVFFPQPYQKAMTVGYDQPCSVEYDQSTIMIKYKRASSRFLLWSRAIPKHLQCRRRVNILHCRNHESGRAPRSRTKELTSKSKLPFIPSGSFPGP